MSKSDIEETRGEGESLLALVDELVREVRQGGRVTVRLDSSLERDLGLDSLSRVELLARIEQRFGVALPAELIDSAETPRALLRALASSEKAVHSAQSTDRVVLPGGLQEAAPLHADTLVELLDWHVTRHPERTHVTFYRTDTDTETLSYAELADAAARVAQALARMGVKPGQCVALMLPSGLDFFRCFYGILYAGAIPVPMYPPARPSQVEEHLRRQAGILRNCQAPVLITFDQVRVLAKTLTGLAPELNSLTTPAVLLKSEAGGCVATTADDFALFQFTSGSTGAPKGVELTHRNLIANIEAWGDAVELTSADVCVSWLPLYHDMGLIGTWLGSLYHAIPLVLMSPLDFLAHPEHWLWAIHRHRGTVTAAPNFAFDLCVKRLSASHLEGLDLSSWRVAANGAEPVNPDTLERFAQAFAPYGLRPEALMPVYGLAECSVGLAVPPPGRGVVVDRVERETFITTGKAKPAQPNDEQALRLVSCGRPLGGHEVRIVDDNGNILGERRVGKLEFRGPSATSGYHRNAEANAELFHDAWLISGDYAYLADGEIHVTGRSKDMIIRGGRNFYPYELEEAVGGIEGVRKGCVAVFGVSDHDHAGEQLVVVAETATTERGTRDRIEQQVASLASDILGLPPDRIVLAPPHSVLKTSSGKIRRAAVRDALLAGSLGAKRRSPWIQALRLVAGGLFGRAGKLLARARAWLYGGWVWGWFAILLAPSILAILLLPSRASRWGVAHWAARALAALSGCNIKVTGLEHLSRGASVIVANHASYMDGLVLVAALPQPVRFVAKAELMRHRLLRLVFDRIGAVFVERFESQKGLKDVESFIGAADQGDPFLFFAEGTFSAQPGLLPFRMGAFRVASQAALPVVPLAINGTRAVLRDGSWLPRRGKIRVSIAAPIPPQGEGWPAVVALRDKTRSAILAHSDERALEHFK